MTSCRIAVLLSLMVPGSAVHSGEGPDWPGFQGPPSPEWKADDLPLRWSPGENIAWSATLPGYGQSSPVAAKNRIFVTSVSGSMKDSCHVTAIDVATGKTLWQRDFPAASRVENSNYVSKAAPSPVVDGERLIAFFEGGNLAALSHTGEVLWQRNLVEEYGAVTSRHGLGSSLAQFGDLVMVWVERQADPYLLAVDKSSGKTVWKESGLAAASWSTPSLVPVAGGTHLVLSGSGSIAGHDPATGKRLWRLEELSGNSIPTPQPLGDGRFLLGATVGRGEEGGGKASSSNGLVAIRGGSGDAYQAEFTWRSQRATCSFGSPIVHQGLAYFVNATGVLFCLDAASGEELYTARLGDSVWATPLAVGERIYFASRSGTTTVIQAGREFRKLAENLLWPLNAEPSDSGSSTEQKAKPAARGAAPAGQIQYAIAAVPGHILIRAESTVYCVRK